MAKLKRCDLCGAEADDLMSIEFPLEERWMLFFRKKSFCHYADVCLDCLEKIRAERQAQIKANEVDFEVADTPQTDLVEDSPSLVKDLVNAFCEDGTWLERQGVYTLTLAEAKQRAVDIIEAVSRKDTADTPQTESTGSPIGDYRDGVGAWQTDCGWK